MAAKSKSSTSNKWVQLARNVDLRVVLSLLAIFAGVAALWGTMVVTPLKIFVVLLHEVSHGLAAVLTGGSIVKMEVNIRQGGVCYTSGGVRFIVLSAGYLGSMLWGSLIVVLSSRTKRQRWISLAIGAFLLGITVFYVRNLFGFVFALLASGFLLVMGRKLSHEVNAFVLKVIGVTSCLYAVLDIIDDVLERRGIGSDADMLADLTFVPSVVWGVLWVVIAVIVTAYSLLIAAQKPKAVAAQTRL